MSTRHLRRAKPLAEGWRKGLCKFCCGPVEKPRRTFCSDACIHEWRLRTQPAYLRDHVLRRDRGICALCGTDTEANRRSWRALDTGRMLMIRQAAPPACPSPCGRAFWWSQIWQWQPPDTLVRDWLAPRLVVQRQQARAAAFAEQHPATWEADHIIPLAEGGPNTIDNIRTLCDRCHKRETAALRKRLAKSRADLVASRQGAMAL